MVHWNRGFTNLKCMQVLRKGSFLIALLLALINCHAQNVKQYEPLIPVKLDIQTKYFTNSYIVPSLQRGYFCKLEDAVFKKSKFPVSFRLGSRKYVDRLENK